MGLTPDDLTPVTWKLEINQNNLEHNNVVVATRPASGSVTWGPITLFPDRTDIDRMDFEGQFFNRSTLPVNITKSRLIALPNAGGVGHLINTTSSTAGFVTLTDCLLDARETRANTFGARVNMLRCDVSGGEDSFDFWGSHTITDSYVHAPWWFPGAHADNIQSGGFHNVFLTHCTLTCAIPAEPNAEGAVEYPDGWYNPLNAVVQIGNYGGKVWDMTIDDCLCDGGNWMFNDNWRTLDTHPNNYVFGPITVKNSRIGRHFRFGVKGMSDYPDAEPADLPTWIWENNVWDDTGEPV